MYFSSGSPYVVKNTNEVIQVKSEFVPQRSTVLANYRPSVAAAQSANDPCYAVPSEQFCGSDVAGDIPMSVLLNLGKPLPSQTPQSPQSPYLLPSPTATPAGTSDCGQSPSVDIPGDIPLGILWGLNERPAQSLPGGSPWVQFPEKPAPSSAPVVLTSLSSMDVAGDIPMSVLWNLK